MGTSRRHSALARPVDSSDTRAARVAALNALARRDLASEDLRRKLLQKGYDSGVVAPLIGALCAEKLVDDRRYAENFVAYHAARGRGPIRIRGSLRQKLLEASLIEEAVAEYPDWEAHLRAEQVKKFGTEAPGNYADGQRRARFLAYRGYTDAQIRRALGLDVELAADEMT